MEQVIMCKKLTAIFKEDGVLLSGPHICNLTIEKECKFLVEIEQFGFRKITVTSEQDVPADKLITIFSRIERLLILFDGVFVSLFQIEFTDSNNATEECLKACGNHYMNNRLKYHTSFKFCNIECDRLVNFQDVLTVQLYERWGDILEELGIVHQIYLHFMSDNHMPVDVKCAFLIELAEPLVEIVQAFTDNFKTLHPGQEGTTLKRCLRSLINEYGKDIFNKELSCQRKNRLLTTMINSRVRIMHIKRKHTGRYFDRKESILYLMKLSLLYRLIMFKLMGIEDEEYKVALQKCISRLNAWDGVLDKFLL